MSLLHPNRKETAPHLESITPRAALPGGTFELRGKHLLPESGDSAQLPQVFFGEEEASFAMLRPTRAIVRVPEGAIASEVLLRTTEDGAVSSLLYANVGVPMAEDLHLTANPCVDADGNLYAMLSGSRGQRVPVSIYRIDRDLQVRPFARDLLNISALAMGRDGQLYASSRSEGTIYRITPDGLISTFAEGMGIATGIAFDPAGNLCVGDRSGTLFKISPTGEIFVFATLEPSVAAYHLCFGADGTLYVTAPTTASFGSIHAFDAEGNRTTFFHGLGRPQGMAFDDQGKLYVAASYRGHRGIFSIDPAKNIELVVSGNDLVGLCFLEDGCAAIAAAQTVFHVDLGIQGRPLP